MRATHVGWAILWTALTATPVTLTSLGAERLVVVAGGGTNETTGASATQARLKEPFGVAFHPSGSLFIIEMSQGNRLLELDRAGRIRHVSGFGGAGGAESAAPLSTAQFNGPHNLAIAPNGNILVADTWNGRIRKVDLAADRVSNLAGFGVPAGEARRSGPYCVTLDFTGTQLYIADLQRIQRIDLETGASEVVAGNGKKGVPQDGARAVDAPLADPRAVAVDRQGNVYVLERGGHALRVVDPAGRVRTVVNARGASGRTGDNGPAIDATLNGPKHLCIDPDDNVVIADAENHVIRRYLARERRLVHVAGTGVAGNTGAGGPPDRVQLNRPHGVAYGPDGRLYIVDTYNDRILRIEP